VGAFERAHIVGAGHAVIEERAAQELTLLVIDDGFAEGLSDTLADTAMNLSLKRKFVDHGADIVDDAVPGDLRYAGVGVDFDLADLTAIRKGRCRRMRV